MGDVTHKTFEWQSVTFECKLPIVVIYKDVRVGYHDRLVSPIKRKYINFYNLHPSIFNKYIVWFQTAFMCNYVDTRIAFELRLIHKNLSETIDMYTCNNVFYWNP